MAEISSPAEYYTQSIPQQFAAALEGVRDVLAEQPELTAVYEITGAGGGTYGVRAAGTQIEVLPESLPAADMRTTMTVEDWRKGFASNGALDPFVDYIRQSKVAVVKSLKGTVRLELERSDGSTWRSTTMFGDQAEPEVTLRMATDDYAAMMRGELNGQMAFLTGKLTFEGSLPLLMQVGALSA
jgi:putative sterol carrier protein